MNRKETTKFLSELLIKSRFSGMGKYWASEVTLNYGSDNVKRVDYMQFCPVNTMAVSGIEKGEFICYEVKSCLEDYKSGYGQNFIGERNYLVIPMALYKKVVDELDIHTGVIVPIPSGADKHTEFENPTELNCNKEWDLITIKPSYPQNRKYSTTELLFCMLRSGQK